jgi:DNA-binding CsgD family transcriptional regulator
LYKYALDSLIFLSLQLDYEQAVVLDAAEATYGSSVTINYPCFVVAIVRALGVALERSSKQGLGLSPREGLIVGLAARGLTDKEIAQQLNLAPATIKSYWVRIRGKLQATTRGQAIAKMVRQDLQSQLADDEAAYPWIELSKHLACAVAVLELDGRISYVNEHLAHLHGVLSPGKLMHEWLLDHSQVEQAQLHLDRVVSERTVEPFELHVNSNGYARRLLLRGLMAPILSGGTVGRIVTLGHISEAQ